MVISSETGELLNVVGSNVAPVARHDLNPDRRVAGKMPGQVL